MCVYVCGMCINVWRWRCVWGGCICVWGCMYVRGCIYVMRMGDVFVCVYMCMGDIYMCGGVYVYVGYVFVCVYVWGGVIVCRRMGECLSLAYIVSNLTLTLAL